MLRIRLPSLTMPLLLSSAARAGDSDPKGIEFFEKSIRPVLAQ